MGRNSYYNSTYDSKNYGSKKDRQANRQSIFRIIVRILFGVLSVCFAVILALTLLSPVMNPEVWWAFPFLAVGAPIIYIVNFATAMVWLVRWRWKFAMPIIILLLLGSGKISRFAKMDISNHYGEANYRGMTKIMSYNIRSHFNDDGEWSSTDLAQYIDSIAPDIFCLQELRHQKLFDELSPKFQSYNFALSKNMGIYTKYHIVAKSENAQPNQSSESKTMWADIKIGGDTIRVFNNHLESTMIKQKDDQYITSREFIADSLREDKFTDMISRYMNSSISRSQYADSLARIITESPYRVVVCGDFNDTPMSYTFQTIAGGLNDSFVECGIGYAYTYRGFLNTIRIDYILGDDGIEFKSYKIDTDNILSDHHPVIAHFILTKNN